MEFHKEMWKKRKRAPEDSLAPDPTTPAYLAWRRLLWQWQWQRGGAGRTTRLLQRRAHPDQHIDDILRSSMQRTLEREAMLRALDAPQFESSEPTRYSRRDDRWPLMMQAEESRDGDGSTLALGGWLVIIFSMGVLLLIAKLSEKCLNIYIYRVIRRTNLIDWSSTMDPNDNQDSEIGNDVTESMCNDYPPPYSMCVTSPPPPAQGGKGDPPPPYCAYYVTVPKHDGVIYQGNSGTVHLGRHDVTCHENDVPIDSRQDEVLSQEQNRTDEASNEVTYHGTTELERDEVILHANPEMEDTCQNGIEAVNDTGQPTTSSGYEVNCAGDGFDSVDVAGCAQSCSGIDSTSVTAVEV